jgi:hypothetical protein
MRYESSTQLSGEPATTEKRENLPPHIIAGSALLAPHHLCLGIDEDAPPLLLRLKCEGAEIFRTSDLFKGET